MTEETIRNVLTRPYNKSPRRDGYWPSFKTKTRKYILESLRVESTLCNSTIGLFSSLLEDIEEIKEGVFDQEGALNKSVFVVEGGQSVEMHSDFHSQSIIYWKLCDLASNLKLILSEDKAGRGNSEHSEHKEFLFGKVTELMIRLHSIREDIKKQDLNAGCLDTDENYSDLYWLINDLIAEIDDAFEAQTFLAVSSRLNR